MILRPMVERVDLCFTRMRGNGGSIEVGRNSEGAPGSAFAIRAMADSVHRRRCVERDGCLTTCTYGCHGVSFWLRDECIATPNV